MVQSLRLCSTGGCEVPLSDQARMEAWWPPPSWVAGGVQARNPRDHRGWQRTPADLRGAWPKVPI